LHWIVCLPILIFIFGFFFTLIHHLIFDYLFIVTSIDTGLSLLMLCKAEEFLIWIYTRCPSGACFRLFVFYRIVSVWFMFSVKIIFYLFGITNINVRMLLNILTSRTLIYFMIISIRMLIYFLYNILKIRLTIILQLKHLLIYLNTPWSILIWHKIFVVFYLWNFLGFVFHSY